MALAAAFRSPFFRVPFLAFAVVATVATSPPAWHLESQPVDEDIELAAGKSIEKKVQYAASHEVLFISRISGSAPNGSSVRVTHEDATDAGPCDETVLLSGGEDGKWRVGDTPMDVSSSCGTTGTVTITLLNESPSPLKLHWTVIARIFESGEDEPPDGAFVRAEVVP